MTTYRTEPGYHGARFWAALVCGGGFVMREMT